jgi:hypothetical protein
MCAVVPSASIHQKQGVASDILATSRERIKAGIPPEIDDPSGNAISFGTSSTNHYQ